MATISRTGIAGGGTISPAHITNIIDALDGSSSTTTVVASGSFSGSLTGHATSATSASYAITAQTASYVLQAVSASYAPGAAGATFPYTGSAIISGSLAVTGSTSILGDVTMTGQLDGNLAATANSIVDLHLMAKSAGTGKFVVPNYVAIITYVWSTILG
jgi:hypothetical protein